MMMLTGQPEHHSLCKTATALLALGLAAPANLPAQAAKITLKSAEYPCTIGSYNLGSIRISGNTYQGPAYDGAYEKAYRFEVTDGGTINWGGPLGGITEAGKVVSTVLRKSRSELVVGFDIMIQNDRGNFQTISCG